MEGPAWPGAGELWDVHSHVFTETTHRTYVYQTSDTPAASRWGPGRPHVCFPCPRLRRDFHGKAGKAAWHIPALLWPGPLLPLCLGPLLRGHHWEGRGGSSDRDIRAFTPCRAGIVLWPALRELRLKQERQGLHFWTVRDGYLPLEAAGLFHPGVCLRAFLPSSGSKTHLGLLPVHPCLGLCEWRPGIRRFQPRIGCGGHSLAPAHRLLPPPQAPRPCRSPLRTCRPRVAVRRSSRLSLRATRSPQ